MDIIGTIINKPIGWLLAQLYGIFGNYALAILVLTVLINAVLIPLNVRQQKTTAKQSRLTPKMNALKKKYANDKQKYNEELAKLYEREGSNPATGCLPLFIRMPFLYGVYSAISSPLTYILGLSSDVVDKAKELVAPLIGSNVAASQVRELQVVNHLEEIVSQVPGLEQAQGRLNFDLFGINLTKTPQFSFNILESFDIIWIIPLLSFAVTMITTLISQRMAKKSGQPQQPGMGGMLLIMPLFSLFLAFTVPGAVGFYWACSSLISGIIQILMQHFYHPSYINAQEDAKTIHKRREYEKKIIEKAGLQE